MYKFIRAYCARLVYFYPTSKGLNFLRLLRIIFLLLVWYALNIFIFRKISTNVRSKNIFLAEDNRYNEHFISLRDSKLISKNTIILTNIKSKINPLDRFLYRNNLYKSVVLRLIKSKSRFNLFLCEMGTPDQLYLASIISLLGSKISFVQHSECIFNAYWKNFFPFTSTYYVRHKYMSDYLMQNYNIKKSNIIISSNLWKLKVTSDEHSLAPRIILIGQPFDSIREFLITHGINKENVDDYIFSRMQHLIEKARNDNLELLYIQHPREESDAIIIESFKVIKLKDIYFHIDDQIYGFHSSLLLELTIKGLRCNLLGPNYDETIFADTSYSRISSYNSNLRDEQC